MKDLKFEIKMARKKEKKRIIKIIESMDDFTYHYTDKYFKLDIIKKINK